MPPRQPIYWETDPNGGFNKYLLNDRFQQPTCFCSLAADHRFRSYTLLRFLEAKSIICEEDCGLTWKVKEDDGYNWRCCMRGLDQYGHLSAGWGGERAKNDQSLAATFLLEEKLMTPRIFQRIYKIRHQLYLSVSTSTTGLDTAVLFRSEEFFNICTIHTYIGFFPLV